MEPTALEANRSGHLLIRPKTLDTGRMYPLFIFMHGLGGCPGWVVDDFGGLIARQDYYVLIPEAPMAFGDGFSWYRLANTAVFESDAERASDLVEGLVKQLVENHKIDPAKI